MTIPTMCPKCGNAVIWSEATAEVQFSEGIATGSIHIDVSNVESTFFCDVCKHEWDTDDEQFDDDAQGGTKRVERPGVERLSDGSPAAD